MEQGTCRNFFVDPGYAKLKGEWKIGASEIMLAMWGTIIRGNFNKIGLALITSIQNDPEPSIKNRDISEFVLVYLIKSYLCRDRSGRHCASVLRTT